MDGWLNKKIFDGYFGFKIVKLNELYNEDIVKEIKSFFDKESLEIDDISDTLVNSRSSLPHLVNWFKEEQMSEDIILDDDGKLVYSYTYIKRAFKYIHNSAWTPFEIDKIVQIQDLCLTVEPSLLTNHIDIYIMMI